VGSQRIAAEIVTAQKIPTNDLTTDARSSEYHSDNVHFNKQGIKIRRPSFRRVEKFLPG